MKKNLLGLLMVALFAAPMAANATLILTVDDLATAGVDATVTDLSSPGLVTFAGAAGTWTLSVTTGIGQPLNPQIGIDLNSISVSSSSGGTLRLSLTQTDLSVPGGAGPIPLFNAIGGTSYGTVKYAAYGDDGNAAFGQGTLLFSGTTTPNGGAFAAQGSASFDRTDPFSLTLIVDLVHTRSATTSFDFSSSVPEPDSLALLGLGLVGLGLTRRRKAP